MLKLVYTPTSEIKESDIVPGSRWRRKSDGAECVLISDGDNPPHRGWFIVNNAVALKQHSGFSLSHPDESILTWLRRDFERVGEKDGDKVLLNNLPSGHAFMLDGGCFAWLPTMLYSDKCVEALRLDGKCRQLFPRDTEVRDLGPIEIDDSVKGVG